MENKGFGDFLQHICADNIHPANGRCIVCGQREIVEKIEQAQPNNSVEQWVEEEGSTHNIKTATGGLVCTGTDSYCDRLEISWRSQRDYRLALAAPELYELIDELILEREHLLHRSDPLRTKFKQLENFI